MPYRVKFTDKLYRSLLAISDYIAAESPQNADGAADAAVRLIESLEIMPARFPRVGKSRKTGSPVHMTTTHSFNIYYEVDSERELVIILLIQRGTRRMPRRFG